VDSRLVLGSQKSKTPELELECIASQREEVIALRKPPKQRKFSTRRPSGQPVLIVFALLFVAALVAGLSLTGNLSTEAVTALGAVTTALVALINVKKK
jgi:hypothetical protein